MKNTIQYLKKDRHVNKTFLLKLEAVGLEVEYGKYSYWDNQEYVQIGRKKIWLVCEKWQNNSGSVYYRYQNNVIHDIVETIENEKAKAEKADARVDLFFEKLNRS